MPVAAPRRPLARPDGMIGADLCILGAGPGGLSVAAGAAQMGASVVLIEKAAMGGDCLNTGCVPSKALLAAGRAAARVRMAGRFGLQVLAKPPDFARVQAHVAGAIAAIAPHDSPERFASLGVRVIAGAGQFVDPATVMVGDTRIRARRFVIATGSEPAIPPVPGLESVPFLTNETIFALTEAPRHLAILGAGPIGCELAQAFARLGVAVTLIEQATLLGREAADAVAILRAALLADGVTLREGTSLRHCEAARADIRLALEGPSGLELLEASHLLVATGRRPALDGLGLARAGIEAGPAGILVDARLRTTNRRVFAIGDVTGAPHLTHRAGYEAGIVIRNALFSLPARANLSLMPRVTYTEPELAQLGPDEAEATRRHGPLRKLEARFDANDRAIADGDACGWIRVLADRRGRIRAVTIIGPQAGELIGLWSLAMTAGLRIGAIAGLTLPYPTLAEISKRAAGQFFAPALFGPWTRRLVSLVQRFVP